MAYERDSSWNVGLQENYPSQFATGNNFVAQNLGGRTELHKSREGRKALAAYFPLSIKLLLDAFSLYEWGIQRSRFVI